MLLVEDVFDRKELKSILLRFNNDFFCKCLFENEVQKLIKRKKEDETVKLLINHFGTCRYGLKNSNTDQMIVIESNGKGLKMTDIGIKKGIMIPWTSYAGYLLKFIKDGCYFTKKEQNIRVFFPFLYETLYLGKDTMSLDIRNKDDLKAYFFIFFHFVRSYPTMKKVLNDFKCVSNEDIKNRLLFDKEFCEIMMESIRKIYSELIFSPIENNISDIQKAQNSLILIVNVKAIKDMLGIKNIYLKTKFNINNVHYIFDDIDGSRLVLKTKNKKTMLNYMQFSKIIAKG